MPNQPLRVVAIMQAKPGKEADLRELLLSLIEPTTKEDGYISYELHSNNDNPAEFVFIEEWETAAALDSHLQTPHLKAAIEKLPQMLAGELDIRSLTKLG